MPPKDDLLSLWLNHYSESQPDAENTVDRILPSKKNQESRKTEFQATNTRSKPNLGGKIAEYLAKQPSRCIASACEISTEDGEPWTIDNIKTKSIVAMALLFTSHVTRYGLTALSEQHLIQARDSLMQTFNAKDAVNIEVEAYELLSWFAGAMNESWKTQNAVVQDVPPGETSMLTLIQIIQSAIQEHRDLFMKYYTGSRGEFSERTITPIEIAAEKYLIAFCHMRNEERVFRLSRIVQLVPIAEESEQTRLLSYPSLEDTKVPPLPELPPQLDKKSNRRRKKSASLTSKSQKTKADTHHALSEKSVKKSGTGQKRKSTPSHQAQTPSLFDLPVKKKPSSAKKQAMLPGFDDE